MTTQGKFADAIDTFHSILLSTPLLVVDRKHEITEVSVADGGGGGGGGSGGGGGGDGGGGGGGANNNINTLTTTTTPITTSTH